MNPFRSKNPWEILFFAVIFGIASLVFLVPDQPYIVIGTGRNYGRSQSIELAGSNVAQFMGVLSAFLSVGLVVLFFWVRREMRNNRWRK